MSEPTLYAPDELESCPDHPEGRIRHIYDADYYVWPDGHKSAPIGTTGASMEAMSDSMTCPGFDWIDGALTPRPGTCPYAWSGDDGTAKQCVERGHCGCDESDYGSSLLNHS
jgi:hypothetical protein